MQWWCSAQGVAWSWHWRGYPGVWVLVLGLFALYWRLPQRQRSRQSNVAAVAAAFTLWVALDWPLGPLGAGYLASAHAVQFLLIAMVGAPLMLIAAREGLTARYAGATGPGVGWLTHPLVTAVLFNFAVVTTHVPRVVDASMVTALGDFALDMAWLISAVLFWWPVLVPVPVRPGFGVPMKLFYLFVGTLFHSGIAIVLLLAEFPLYRVYEFAPPMTGLSAVEDQQIAGGVMELGGVALIIGYASVLFFRWVRQQEAPTR